MFSPKRTSSSNIEAHREAIAYRRRNVRELYQSFQDIIKKFPPIEKRPELLKLATRISEKVPSLRIDRDAKRSLECLICWYCENRPSIKNLFLTTYYEVFYDPVLNKYKKELELLSGIDFTKSTL